jgi:site-specific recombinase XerD
VSSTKVLKDYFGDMLIKNMTPADIHPYTLARIEQGRVANTVNAEIGHLGHMFTWAVKMKLTAQNPVKGITQLKGNKKARYLSREEIDRLIAVCRGDLRDMVILALGTGMRASEVLNVTREQVD